MLRISVLLLALVGFFVSTTAADTWGVTAQSQYSVTPNVTYLVESGYENKLDIYLRRNATTPQPTLLYIHGGGWTGGSKEASVMSILPWLEMGWTVVNVEYRLARIAPAPAAVEDCLCALKWTVSHAAEYHFDPAKIVVSGDSAGGHLALMTGITPTEAGLDRECPSNQGDVPLPKVAAIVNWYGITDVADILQGPNRKSYAVAWLGSASNREEIARRVSPLSYIRPGLPPIFTVQGDADPTVPYTHSLRLREALNKAGVPNELVTIPGGKHGMFTAEERIHIFTELHTFLEKYNLPVEVK